MSPQDRELMQQALEDLRMVAPDTCVETIEALRARLAEPDDEPVAVVGPVWQLMWIGGEPIAHILARHPDVRIGSKLYTRPAARKVQPLTDKQMLALAREYAGKNFPAIASPELWFLRGIKAAQRAHGITGDSHE